MQRLRLAAGAALRARQPKYRIKRTIEFPLMNGLRRAAMAANPMLCAV